MIYLPAAVGSWISQNVGPITETETGLRCEYYPGYFAHIYGWWHRAHDQAWFFATIDPPFTQFMAVRYLHNHILVRESSMCLALGVGNVVVDNNWIDYEGE